MREGRVLRGLDTEEVAERLPAFGDLVDEKLVFRHALPDLLIDVDEGFQSVFTILEPVSESLFPDEVGD